MLATILILTVLSGVVTFFFIYSHLRPHKSGTVLALAKCANHGFSKDVVPSITLIAGLGIEGDCHSGKTVQHLFRMVGPVEMHPANLRQVHLMHSELFSTFAEEDAEGKKFEVTPGQLGENITTKGLDLLSLSEGTRLHFINPSSPLGGSGARDDCHAIVRVTGLRHPCFKIDKFRKGLKERCLVRDEERKIKERLAGIMSVVEVGGVIVEGAQIVVEKPWRHKKLKEV